MYAMIEAGSRGGMTQTTYKNIGADNIFVFGWENLSESLKRADFW